MRGFIKVKGVELHHPIAFDNKAEYDKALLSLMERIQPVLIGVSSIACVSPTGMDEVCQVLLKGGVQFIVSGDVEDITAKITGAQVQPESAEVLAWAARLARAIEEVAIASGEAIDTPQGRRNFAEDQLDRARG